VPLAGSDWVSHIDDPDQLDFEWTSRREAFSSATTEKEQRDIVISCFTERLACLLSAAEKEGCMVDQESRDSAIHLGAKYLSTPFSGQQIQNVHVAPSRQGHERARAFGSTFCSRGMVLCSLRHHLPEGLDRDPRDGAQLRHRLGVLAQSGPIGSSRRTRRIIPAGIERSRSWD
jgi:hypothetical protein